MGEESLEQKLRQIESLGESAFEKLRANEPLQAVSDLEQAIGLTEALGIERLQIVLKTYLAQAEKMLGHDEAAFRRFEEIIALTSKQEGFADLEIIARVFLAEMLKDKGEFNKALKHFQYAYNLASFIKDTASMELSAGNLGSVTFSLGNLEAACDWFKTALDLSSDKTDNLSLWLGSLGLTMSELGQFDKARQYYQDSYQLAEKNEDFLTMSICRGSIGNIDFEAGNYEMSSQAYEEARKLAKQAGDERREGIWLGNVGIAASRCGDQEKALLSLQEALALATAIGDKQSMAAHLDSLGDCFKAKGDPSKSSEYYLQAVELSRQIEDRMGERIYLANLARLKKEQGELNPAYEYFVQASELFDEQRGQLKADDLKTSFADRGQSLYRDLIATCLSMGKRVEALEFVGRAKSRALLDLLSNSPIDISAIGSTASGADQAIKTLIAREADLRAQIAQLERLYWQGDGGGPSFSQYRGAQPSQEDTRALYGQWREVLNQLKRRHPNYAGLVSSTTLRYEEIKSLWIDGLLKDDTAIVEFFLTEEYMLAALATSEQADSPPSHMIFDQAEIAKLKSDVSTFLEMSSTEGWEVPVSLCKRLYSRLLGDLLDKVPASVKRLVLVPHGVLYHLPLAALHDGKGYLCQRYATSYVPSVSVIPLLARNLSRRLSGRIGKLGKDKDGGASYLVSAISDYSKTRESGMVFSSRLRSSSGLEDLAYTMEEAKSIADLGKSLAQKDAESEARLITNEEVKQALPTMFGQYEVVHFAGHAVFNHEEPLASGLVLSDGSILSAASILEGNSLRTEKGFLLVLSACQTGVSVVTEGGEILGLTRALMYAGMPNLVLSLWEVADRSTSDLMQDFHMSLAGRSIKEDLADSVDSIAGALRMAQMKAIDEKQPIHAWAPFIHFGID
ncbi:MAG: CHAT domain-containing protein [Candidatus Obscuribacterales bacterium]|nr:CHAT domain-containing protein [Candidatus Obscuribacterales bacterium]